MEVLAVVAYNRLGAEGETARTEGGVSRTLTDLPVGLTRALDAWRLAKAGWA